MALPMTRLADGEVRYERPTPLPADPFDAIRLENDVLGVRLWGPASQPTLSIGRADIWDRRWFEDRQPLITAARIRELAFADRLSDVAATPNTTAYDLYGRYDFPCPKPGVQASLRLPFGERATVERGSDGGVRLTVTAHDKRIVATIAVALGRPIVFMEITTEGDGAAPLAVRMSRHRDTILPGQPLDPTLGDARSPLDFEPLPPPRSWSEADRWGVVQAFPAEPTFPDGFRFLGAVVARGAQPVITKHDDEKGLGTPLWAEKEGRLSHGVIKRYTPINEAAGSAATAAFDPAPRRLALFLCLCSSQDGPDVAQSVERELSYAARAGLPHLRRENETLRVRSTRRTPARAAVEGASVLAAPVSVLPPLRKKGGHYGDVALCSVDSTKFCFQDAAIWHADFHLNEIRAEGMLTLGQFEEVRPYCEMIRTMLPQAVENARAVYGLPGAMYPLVGFPLKSRGVAHTNLTWEQDLGLNGLIAKPLWLWYRHTGDRGFLRETAYPVLRECARFLAAYVTEEADGLLHIVPTVSPEHWGLTPRFERNRDCTSALTLTRYLLGAAASAAALLRVDRDDAATWRSAAGRLAPFPTHDSPSGPVWVDVAGAPPIEYNIPVPLSPVFWGDEVGLDSPADTLAIARRTLDQINVWVPHRGYLNGSVRPRLGIWVDGMTIGAENLLQSYQSLRVFPSAPPRGEIVMEHFAAEGGFRVSAVRASEGVVRDLRIRSTVGGACRLANPWPSAPVRVTDSAGNTIAQTAGGAAHIPFATRRGAEYRVEAQVAGEFTGT